jgi:hypothetical protein
VDLTTELAAIIDALDAAGIPYALCGGLAVALHGHIRATQDIDLLIRPANLQSTLNLLRQMGFNLDGGVIPLGDADHPVDLHRISRAIGRDMLTVDLIPVSPELEAAWASRTVYPWADRSLTAVSREGLGVMKRLSRRRIDLDDLEQLGIPADEPR